LGQIVRRRLQAGEIKTMALTIGNAGFRCKGSAGKERGES